MFSGALGKFVPNPDLRPERQDLFETGLTARGQNWNLTTAAFLQNLSGGIEKEKLTDGSGRFMRLNRTEIRIPGWEILGSYHPHQNLSLTAQHTILAALVQNHGDFTDPAGVKWNLRLGFRWQQEGRSVAAHIRVNNIIEFLNILF